MDKQKVSPALPPEWLTTGQAAAYLQVTRRTVYRWMDAGSLRYYSMPSGRRRLRKEDLDALLSPSEAGPQENFSGAPAGGGPGASGRS